MDSPSLLASSVGGDVGPELTTRKRGCSNDSDSDDSADNSDFKRTKLAISNTAFKFSLNSDVLLEIFEHGCSTPASIAPNAGLSVAPGLVFSQVCRSWRSLALAQSRLWSSFSWYKDASAEEEDEYEEDKPDEPIIGDERFHDTPEIRKYLVDSVFNIQKRLKRLKLHCEQGTLPEGKAYRLDSAPMLESLNFKISQYDPKLKPVSISKAIAVDLSNLGSLRDLSLTGNVFIIRQFNDLKSLQLVLLRLNNVVGVDPLERPRRSFAMSTSDLFAVLNSSPNIYWITSVVSLPNTLPVPPQRLLLHRLRKLGLILESGSAAVLNSLFQSLDLPLLTGLNLVLYGTGRGLEGIRSWAIGSTLESVTELKITCDWSRNPIDEDLRSLLICMPRLDFLNLHSDCISSQTLLLLTLQPSGE
ncbi:hypothetical protein SCHPADRAFT_987169 [Schizopora paradoxa]|uniref:F-box domain-containing protein n=1 Tax=Schizopora paradoxa TaxID=27342 RepID=A0A0H2R3S8_9AGAM|nr:hypothetical protein SCHPADRAFT_987169 [Schizopora paradoxa]